MSDDDQDGQAPHLMLEALPPYSFGLSERGALQLMFYVIQGGIRLKFCVAIPPEEVRGLRLGLEQSAQIQETLAAIPPTRSKH